MNSEEPYGATFNLQLGSAWAQKERELNHYTVIMYGIQIHANFKPPHENTSCTIVLTHKTTNPSLVWLLMKSLDLLQILNERKMAPWRSSGLTAWVKGKFQTCGRENNMTHGSSLSNLSSWIQVNRTKETITHKKSNRVFFNLGFFNKLKLIFKLMRLS